MAVPRFVGGPVAQPTDGQPEQSGILGNPVFKWGLIAVGVLVVLHFIRGSGTQTGPAVTTVPDSNNLSTLANLENAVNQDYAQNQQFQQQFLSWLNAQNGGGHLPIDPPSTPPGGNPVPNPSPPGQTTSLSDAGFYNGPTPGESGGPGYPGTGFSWAWRWSNWWAQKNPGTDTSLHFGATPGEPGGPGYPGPGYSWEWTWLKTPGDLSSGPQVKAGT